MAKTFTETLFDSYGQQFRIDEMLFENQTDHQHLVIFHNQKFGRVMALDGIVQTTEKDEFIYHEMLTHVPILSHGNARSILIIGGGDGAMLREVVRHASVRRATQVEIDQQVIDMCLRYLPKHSRGAFEDPRAEVIIEDGRRFVDQTDQRFDVIISDSTDPIGPGEALFTSDFYRGCKRCLNPGGILVTQNGVAYMQLDEVRTTAGRLKSLFEDWHFYMAAIPTYIGGGMAFGWASDTSAYRRLDVNTLRKRFAASGIRTRYYTPEVHAAAFALPRYVLEAIGKNELQSD